MSLCYDDLLSTFLNINFYEVFLSSIKAFIQEMKIIKYQASLNCHLMSPCAKPDRHKILELLAKYKANSILLLFFFN
jgi:hypothetical protein